MNNTINFRYKYFANNDSGNDEKGKLPKIL